VMPIRAACAVPLARRNVRRLRASCASGSRRQGDHTAPRRLRARVPPGSAARVSSRALSSRAPRRRRCGAAPIPAASLRRHRSGGSRSCTAVRAARHAAAPRALHARSARSDVRRRSPAGRRLGDFIRGQPLPTGDFPLERRLRLLHVASGSPDALPSRQWRGRNGRSGPSRRSKARPSWRREERCRAGRG